MNPSTTRSVPPPRGAADGTLSRSRPWLRRAALPVTLLLGALVLGGCDEPTFGQFRGATVQGHDEFKLWVGTVIAGLVVAAIVYALIFWAVFRYRRKGEGFIPKQFHEHRLLEVVYTAIPVIIVGFLFYFTVLTENNVDALTNKPTEVIDVLAYRWGWQFTYNDGSGHAQGVVVRTAATPQLLPAASTSPEYPQLVLPKGTTVEIDLSSADVVHGFYIPEFDFSRYAQPGVMNRFDFTPTTVGVYRAQCSTYCGLYHSEMLFSVKVVSQAQFQQWLSSSHASQAQGATT